jgi:predicted hotdog family 3-hydroxylacyl-ACP dehydratase
MPITDTLDIESLIPHRGRMLLVDEILAITHEQATVLSVTHDRWPLYADGTINPLILVELVAQAAGIHNSLKRTDPNGQGEPTRGWLVGVKSAQFHVAAIASGETVTTTTTNAFVFDNLREIRGTATIGGRPAADVVLQIVEAQPEDTNQS